MDRTARQFAYEFLAQYLHHGPYDPVNGLRQGLTGSHPISVNPEKSQRLGAVGDKLHMALISESRTVLKANILPAKPLPSHVELKPQNWRSNAAWRAEIMVAPPAEPYMVIVFGKSTDYLDRLRLSSVDALVECGPNSRRYNLRQIQIALANLDEKELIDHLETKKLVHRRLIEPDFPQRLNAKLCAMACTYPYLFESLEILPDYGTAEYEALIMIANVRSFQARRRNEVSENAQ